MISKIATLGIIFSTLLAFTLSKPKNDTTIFMIGDSTMADKPYKDGNPEKGWGQVLGLYFKEGVTVDNHAMNGRSSKSFINEGRWQGVREKIRPGDYVIIQFGHNDQKEQSSERYAAPETTYRENLLKFVRETKELGALPILATPIVRRRFDDRGQFYDTHGEYPKVVREVAEEQDIPLLDLHLLSRKLLINYGKDRSKILFLHIPANEYPSVSEDLADDTHLSPTGAFRICDLAIQELRKEVSGLRDYIKD